MSRWLIAMEGTMQDPTTGENEVKTIEELENNSSGILNKNNEVIEKKKSFNRKEDNPEGDITGTNVEVAISNNGQENTQYNGTV